MMYQDIDKTQYTPMMQQYLDIKKDYVDTLVFFRLGDFYEMFFNDAFVASKELEIALTGRDAGAKERVPMCGIPYHAVDVYIEKLIEKGYRVAIVEQVEAPGLGKKIVKREVVRLITPGTVIDRGAITDKDNNYLVALSEIKGEYIIAYSDFSTGENYVTKVPNTPELLVNEILILNAKEVIIPTKFNTNVMNILKKKYQIVVSFSDEIDVDQSFISLVKGINDEALLETFGRLLNYIIKTQKRSLLHLKPLEIYASKQFLKMDIHSLNNLEIMMNMRNNIRYGSLLWVLDNCKTAMGSRELKKWLTKPLLDKNRINQRYDFIDALHQNYEISASLSDHLKTVYDLERIVGRISYGNSNARDLLQLKKSLEKMPLIKETVAELKTPYALLLADQINPLDNVYELLEKAIDENAPLSIKEGGIIKSEYNQELDNLRHASTHGKNWLVNYEQEQRALTGIKTMKVGYNRVFGYYIEVSKGAVASLPTDIKYERKQTLANAERYITEELKEYEQLILNAKEKSISLEYDLFVEIRNYVANYIYDLQLLASSISQIDVLLSFAIVSEKNNYIRPILSDKQEVNIVDGRHPVLEALSEEVFVANDIVVNKYNTLLITGPNMSGKSTYMRQLAMICIMAQIGCFVPAGSATLPVIDQIFTRIGAADDLVSGQSTFMVEMVEVNNALKNATKNSLLLFDEIGRGTATYDGMALAQAIIEYAHEKIGAITLFSTHYHELTVLEKTLKRLKNIHVSAKDEKGGLVFLHKVIDGPTDKSYGINVASLAKLPTSVITRAKQILHQLEIEKGKTEIELDLFNFEEASEEAIVTTNPVEQEVLERIKEIDVDDLSPRDALNVLYELKRKIK